MIQYNLSCEGLEIYRVLFNTYYTKTFYSEYEKLNDYTLRDERGL